MQYQNKIVVPELDAPQREPACDEAKQAVYAIQQRMFFIQFLDRPPKVFFRIESLPPERLRLSLEVPGRHRPPQDRRERSVPGLLRLRNAAHTSAMPGVESVWHGPYRDTFDGQEVWTANDKKAAASQGLCQVAEDTFGVIQMLKHIETNDKIVFWGRCMFIPRIAQDFCQLRYFGQAAPV